MTIREALFCAGLGVALFAALMLWIQPDAQTVDDLTNPHAVEASR